MNKIKPLSIKETALKEEMKSRCLNKGQYIDENAQDKFKMLCHLEDFEIAYWELLKKTDTYENPKDLTLMYMYCDEKAKDKIKELKRDIKNLVRIISKNCDDLEATEEEFESLYRGQNEWRRNKRIRKSSYGIT